MTGEPHSAEPAYMPTDYDEAIEFRDRALADGESMWCGTLLGGCGGRLKMILPSARIPHFSHRGESNLCARLARGSEHTLGGQSADHLYAQRHVRQWLSQRERATTPGGTEYVGLAPGKACTEVVIPLSGSESVRIVLTHDLDHELLEIARSPIARDYVWLVRANDALTSTLFRNGVPYRKVRLVAQHEHGRAVEVGLPDGTGETLWTALDQCVLRGGTLHRASTPTNPDPLAPRREPSPAPEGDPDPLELAIRGLRHVMAAGEARGTILTMAETVRRQLRAARARGLTADMAVEATAVLGEAGKATRVQAPVERVPQPRRRALDRVVSESEQVLERVRQKRRTQQIARRVEQLVGKLNWAMTNGRSDAYRDNRAQLVAVLDRPETSRDIAEQVQAHLRDFPQDFFAPTPTRETPRARSGKREPERGQGGSRRQRGRRGGNSDRKKGGGARASSSPAPAPPPRQESLEVQATIDDRSREILESIRASGRRPTPRVPPPERW